MSKFDSFILKNFTNFIKEIGYEDNILVNEPIWEFRFVCYMFNHFIQHINLPIIKQKGFYEAVFIDFRVLPNIEFIIRNAILKLGSNWSHTIICGLDNYNFMCNIVKNIGRNINIICLEYNNLSQEEYSLLLTKKDFWHLFYGEKILIYQEDSLIFQNNISPFLKYDFIGAPFSKSCNDTPNCVGNGGLSLRTKLKMIEVIDNFRLEELAINSSTKTYMEINNLKYAPEDVYFSKNMQEYNIGEVANWNTAYFFSSEQIFNEKSFGGHKFWISNNDWKKFVLKLFKYNKYKPNDDLNKYLTFKNLPLSFNKNKNIKNAFDIDIHFFCCVNNITYINDKDTLEHINNFGLDGFIYHPKQLYNIFGNNIYFYNFLDNVYTFYYNNIYTIQEFVNKHIYNVNFDSLADLLIKKKYDTLNNNYDTILLVFLGNYDISIDLLKRIIKYKKINFQFNIAFCINKNMSKDLNEIKNIIKNNFDFYAIYYSVEFGTDIIPTMLMYNDIIKLHNINHILKFHTKTISNIYNNLTNYLLKNSLDTIIQNKNPNCNCINNPDSYISLTNDIYNNKLKIKHADNINLHYYFVGGTIFYCENRVFYQVLNFMKNNNFRSYLLNNLYENNSINQEFSPIHFVERLFGVIKL